MEGGERKHCVFSEASPGKAAEARGGTCVFCSRERMLDAVLDPRPYKRKNIVSALNKFKKKDDEIHLSARGRLESNLSREQCDGIFTPFTPKKLCIGMAGQLCTRSATGGAARKAKGRLRCAGCEKATRDAVAAKHRVEMDARLKSEFAKWRPLYVAKAIMLGTALERVERREEVMKLARRIAEGVPESVALAMSRGELRAAALDADRADGQTVKDGLTKMLREILEKYPRSVALRKRLARLAKKVRVEAARAGRLTRHVLSIQREARDRERKRLARNEKKRAEDKRPKEEEKRVKKNKKKPAARRPASSSSEAEVAASTPPFAEEKPATRNDLIGAIMPALVTALAQGRRWEAPPTQGGVSSGPTFAVESAGESREDAVSPAAPAPSALPSETPSATEVGAAVGTPEPGAQPGKQVAAGTPTPATLARTLNIKHGTAEAWLRLLRNQHTSLPRSSSAASTPPATMAEVAAGRRAALVAAGDGKRARAGAEDPAHGAGGAGEPAADLSRPIAGRALPAGPRGAVRAIPPPEGTPFAEILAGVHPDYQPHPKYGWFRPLSAGDAQSFVDWTHEVMADKKKTRRVDG